jgi:hypothetical protein
MVRAGRGDAVGEQEAAGFRKRICVDLENVFGHRGAEVTEKNLMSREGREAAQDKSSSQTSHPLRDNFICRWNFTTLLAPKME